MNDEQWKEATAYFADWLNKASVGCWLIGIFQPSHLFGGIIGAIVCGLAGFVIKIWSKR